MCIRDKPVAPNSPGGTGLPTVDRIDQRATVRMPTSVQQADTPRVMAQRDMSAQLNARVDAFLREIDAELAHLVTRPGEVQNVVEIAVPVTNLANSVKRQVQIRSRPDNGQEPAVGPSPWSPHGKDLSFAGFSKALVFKW